MLAQSPLLPTRRPHHVLRPLFCLLMLFALNPAARAEPADCQRSSADELCVAPGQWEFGVALGLGYASNPLVEGDDLKLPLLPRLTYYGERFFVETTTLGFTLDENQSFRFNLLAKPNLDYLYFSGSGSFAAALNPPFPSPHPFPGPPPAELKRRRMTYLAGLELSYFSGNWQWQSSVLSDVSVGHHGFEADSAAIYHWQQQSHQLDAGLGLKYRDQRLSDYYFGLDYGEFVDPDYRYTAAASLSPYVTLNYRYTLSANSRLLALIALQRAGDSIENSPIVASRWFSASFIGVAYDF